MDEDKKAASRARVEALRAKRKAQGLTARGTKPVARATKAAAPTDQAELAKHKRALDAKFNASVEAAVAQRLAAARRAAQTPSPSSDELAAALAKHKRELDAEFDNAVARAVHVAVEARVAQRLREVQYREAQARKIIAARRGVFSGKAFNAIVKVLHTDTTPDPERRNEALRLFLDQKDVLLRPDKKPPKPKAAKKKTTEPNRL